MKSKQKLCFFIALNIIISIILIPIIGRYRGVETLSWILGSICILLGLYIVYYLICKRKEHIFLAIIPIVLIFIVISSYWLYEPIKSRVVTAGIEHYEIEYHSYDSTYYPNDENYDWMIEDYKNPVLTTIGDLKTKIPIEQPDTYVISIKPREIELDDDVHIWVYATVYEHHIANPKVFLYDNLKVSQNSIEIKTHFKVLGHRSSSLDEMNIVVLSIVPADQ